MTKIKLSCLTQSKTTSGWHPLYSIKKKGATKKAGEAEGPYVEDEESSEVPIGQIHLESSYMQEGETVETQHKEMLDVKDMLELVDDEFKHQVISKDKPPSSSPSFKREERNTQDKENDHQNDMKSKTKTNR